MPNNMGGWYIINPPPIKNNNKIYEILFGGLKYNSYLCNNNVRHMLGWGRNTLWSVDSDLPYILYISPHFFFIPQVSCQNDILFISLYYGVSKSYSYGSYNHWGLHSYVIYIYICMYDGSI